MLTDEKTRKMLNTEHFYFESILHLDCFYNKMHIKNLSLSIDLNEAQKRLMLCMMNNINCKREIIKVVWNDNHQRIRDNNYHQLVFQFRSLLGRNKLPSNLIITVPYYGLKLNEPLLRAMNAIELSGVANSSQAERRRVLPHWLSKARSLF